MMLPLQWITIASILMPVVRPSRPTSAAVFQKLLPKAGWDALFPERWYTSSAWKEEYNSKQPWYYPRMNVDYYAYDNFVKAIKFIEERGLKKFLNEPKTKRDERKRELCAFLGNIAHETGKGDNGLFYREEYSFERVTNEEPGAYQSVGSRTDYKMNNAPVYFRKKSQNRGKVRFTRASYHGRGPMQLSWGYNYGDFSKFAFGDPQVLLDNPDKLLDDPVMGIASALWFWMANMDRPPQKIPHNVMYKSLSPVKPWGFGRTIMAINGEQERNAVLNGQTKADIQVTRRVAFYKKCAELLKVTVGVDGEQLDTKGMN